MEDMVSAKPKLSVDSVRVALLRDWNVSLLEGEIMMSAWVPWSLTVPMMGKGPRIGSCSGFSGSRSLFFRALATSLMCVVIFGYNVDSRVPIMVKSGIAISVFVFASSPPVCGLPPDVAFGLPRSFIVKIVKCR